MAFMPASKRQSGIAAIRTNINLIALADIHGDVMAERRHYSHRSEWTILKMAVLVYGLSNVSQNYQASVPLDINLNERMLWQTLEITCVIMPVFQIVNSCV